MLLLILSCLLGVAVLPIAILVIKVMKGKKNLEYYKQQGMPTIFSATLGHLMVEDKTLPENSKKSNFEYLKKVAMTPECRSAGAFATNFVLRTESIVHLLTSDMIKEFLLKEDCFERADLIPELSGLFGLASETNEKSARSKALFLKMFRPEGLEIFTPLFCKAIHEGLTEFAKNNNIERSKYTKFSLEDVFSPVMDKIAKVLIFGNKDADADPELLELPRLMRTIFRSIRPHFSNPCTIILPQKLNKVLGLTPHAKLIEKSFARQKEILQRYVDKRSLETNLGESMIDRSIAHNRECQRNGNTKDLITIHDIAGNYNLFLIAGSDAAMNLSIISLCYMTDFEDQKKFIQAINEKIYDSEGFTTTQAIESCQELTLWMKETLRVHPTLLRSFERIATKDVKLGNFIIQKGDFVTMAFVPLFSDPGVFKNADTFDVTRFTSENEKLMPRYQFIPFSLGKRVCLGRHLGEIMAKLLVTKFIQLFEFEKPADVEYYKEMDMSVRITQPFVNIRLK
jgi:cytochrome P450